MTGYSLFIRTFAPFYYNYKYRDAIRSLDALGPTMFHYAAYLWNNLSPIEKARWTQKSYDPKVDMSMDLQEILNRQLN